MNTGEKERIGKEAQIPGSKIKDSITNNKSKDTYRKISFFYDDQGNGPLSCDIFRSDVCSGIRTL